MVIKIIFYKYHFYFPCKFLLNKPRKLLSRDSSVSASVRGRNASPRPDRALQMQSRARGNRDGFVVIRRRGRIKSASR